MWLYNIISINNLLLAILLLIIFSYFAVRADKTAEVFAFLVFVSMLFIWQLCFIFNNTLFDPVSAYPLFYFHNSGYTVFAYLGLAMFSYYFIKPVFPRERAIVLVLGLLVACAILARALFVEFQRPLHLTFNPALDVYRISPVPLRRYIVIMLFILSGIVAKNMIVKLVLLRGDSRKYLLKIFLCLGIGIVTLPLSFIAVRYFNVDENVANSLITFVTGLCMIYFFWSYIDNARIGFYYSDKTGLIILFMVIIIINIISSFTFMVYKQAYFVNLDDMVRQIHFDVSRDVSDRAYYLKRYGRIVEYITLKDTDDGDETYLVGRQPLIPVSRAELPLMDSGYNMNLQGDDVYLFRNARSGRFLIQTGFPYLTYRKYIHGFVSIGFNTALGIVVVLFFLIRFMVTISLIRPLRSLLDGIENLQKGRLDHRIEVTSLDEIGYISEQFNDMVSDLSEGREEIRQSEKKYRELTALLPDIIYETDTNLDITYLNETGFLLTGYSPDDLAAGLPMRSIMEAEDYRVMEGLLDRREDGAAVTIFIHTVKRKDGSAIIGENKAAVITADHRIVGIRGIIRDVTEKQRLEQRLIQSQKMEIIGSLAGGIAHDFNNILGGIVGSISLIEYKLKNNERMGNKDLGEDFEVLKTSAERAMKMVEQILTISKRKRLTMGLTDLNRIVGHVYGICKNTFDKKIELDFRYNEAVPNIVMGDATQLEQVLLNLCINSRDAMTIMRGAGAEHAGTLAVSLYQLRTDNDFIAKYPDATSPEYRCLRVSDTGVGMDAVTRERVFDPFFTTKETLGGTGLGLAMVYNIIKQHNGFIDVYSEVGAGTTFTVYIPSSTIGIDQADEAVRAPEQMMGEGTILVIEDDPTVRKTCEKILRILGYDVILAENGLRGIEVFRERRREIDGIILDMVMPKRSGKETFIELKAIDPGVKVLLTSGFRNDARIDEVLKLGAQGFLQKPYTMADVSKGLTQLLSGSDG